MSRSFSGSSAHSFVALLAGIVVEAAGYPSGPDLRV